MGGGGFLGLGPAPSAPAPPDYRGAAQETAAGNLEAARAATAANRVNQITPYGNLSYSITGADPYGNPTWTATQTLSPAQQQLLDYQNQASIGLGKLAGKGLGYVENMLATPFDTSRLPSTGFNPSQTYQEAYMQRLAPQLQMGREQLAQDLANKGIDIGSKAYENAMRIQAQRENDLLAAATTQGFNVGQQARQTALQEQAYLRNEPLNTLSAVRTGAQVQGPQFVNSAQQATTAGPDILGAANMQYNAAMGDFNAKQAAQANLNQGLFGLGGAGIMAMCDPRTKENVKAIGVMANGLTLYSFEYKDEFKDHEFAGDGVHVGVMADEVEQVFPYAVKTLDDGYKVVDYGLIP
jgi:hypothetical protein